MGKNSDGLSLRKVAFWSIVVITIMYLVAQRFRWISADTLAGIADWIGWAAGIVALALVAILAWDYVRSKHQTVWTVLYLLILLVALVFMVLPRIL